jgi:hypothetical protein
MRCGYRFATISLVLVIGVWTSSVAGDVHLEGMLSSGEKFDGKLLRDDGQRLIVKGKKRTFTFMGVNVVECTVRVTDAKIPRDVEGLPLSGRAKFLLLKGHRFLAEVMFLCSLGRTAERGESGGLTLALWAMERAPFEKLVTGRQVRAIEKIYADSRYKLPPRLGGPDTKTWSPRRYRLPSPQSVADVLSRADAWGKGMKRIAPDTHRIETEHFIIYSAWSKSDDAKLRGIYEKLYVALCKQFDIPPTDNIWIGKLPVFAFWKKKDFTDFGVKVVEVSPRMARESSGYAGYRGRLQYVILGPVLMKGMTKADARTWFYELLVHESTHAFMLRYINPGRVVNWLNEGIAEMISAALVPKGSASRKLRKAHAAVKQGKGSEFLPMFTARNIPMGSESYGAAQSLARFLLLKGRKKFIQLVYELKGGSDSETALGKVYELTHEELLNQWIRKNR